MSAYICDKNHFLYLVAAALSPRLVGRYGPFSWFHDGQRHQLPTGAPERAAEVANMLHLENVRSVSHRYPGDKSSATLPGPIHPEAITAADFLGCFETPDLAQLAKAIHCLEYQSCEHPEWKDSEAWAFLDALSGAILHALPGYEDAEWGNPEHFRQAGVVLLSGLSRRRR